MLAEFIRRLFLDENLKLECAANWSAANPSMGSAALEKEWRSALSAVRDALKNIPDGQRVCEQSIRQCLLEASELGFTLDPISKKAYLEVTVNDSGRFIFSLLLGYNGLRQLILRESGARFIATNVVYEGDTFEWRGPLEMPLYVRRGEKSGEVVASFATAVLGEGQSFSAMLESDELYAIAQQDIDRCISIYGTPDYSLYNGPWRKRMFEIASIRHLYRSFCCKGQESSGVVGNDISDQDFLNQLESDLASVTG